MSTCAPARSAISSQRVVRPDCRIDDHQIRVAEVRFPMPAELVAVNRYRSERFQGIARRSAVAVSVTVTTAPARASQRAAALPPPKRPNPITVTRSPSYFMAQAIVRSQYPIAAQSVPAVHRRRPIPCRSSQRLSSKPDCPFRVNRACRGGSWSLPRLWAWPRDACYHKGLRRISLLVLIPSPPSRCFHPASVLCPLTSVLSK